MQVKGVELWTPVKEVEDLFMLRKLGCSSCFVVVGASGS